MGSQNCRPDHDELVGINRIEDKTNLFADDFVGFLDAWNKSHARSTPELHTQIAQWVSVNLARGRRRLALLAFRDSGKSTLAALFCAWQLASNPNLRILVLSAEQQLARKFTGNTRHVVERHPGTGHLMPTGTRLWSADQFTVRRQTNFRDPSLLARGILGNLTGCRADLIICDDVEVPNNCDTPLKQDSLRARLKELDYILVPDGMQLYVGTPHTFRSIYTSTSDGLSEPSDMFLRDFETLALPVLSNSGESRWPDRFTDRDIQRIKDGTGLGKFRSQMLLRPSRMDEARLDPDLLLSYSGEITFPVMAGKKRPFLEGRLLTHAIAAWDPSYAKDESHDSSVVAVMYRDDSGHYWLHDIKYLRKPHVLKPEDDEATYYCTLVLRFVARHRIRVLAVESNGLGQFLPSLLRNQARKINTKVAIVEQHTHVPKARRILEAFDVLMSGGRLHLHERVRASPFSDEMRDWRPGKGGRDDGLDAVAACILSLPMTSGNYQYFGQTHVAEF